jgi:hypothetical protein
MERVQLTEENSEREEMVSNEGENNKGEKVQRKRKGYKRKVRIMIKE